MNRRAALTVVGAALLVLGAAQVAVSVPASAATGSLLSTVVVRSGPGDANSPVGTMSAGATVAFHCYVSGQRVSGRYGTEAIWDALDSGGFVPDAQVYTGSNSAVVPACASAQFGVGNYPVAWTGEDGYTPRTSTDLGADSAGGYLRQGLVVPVTCETSGQTVTDAAGFTSGLWDRLAGGGWIPNVYLDTQVNGNTPGLPTCSGGGSRSGGSGSGGSGSGGSGSGGSGSGGSGSGESGSGGGSASGSSGDGPVSGGGNETNGPVSGSAGTGTGQDAPVHGAGDPCISRFAPGASTTRSIFGGRQTNYDRTASQLHVCQGFGLPDGVSPSPGLACTTIALLAASSFPGVTLKASEVCDRLQYAYDVGQHHFVDFAHDLTCDVIADMAASGAAALAVGATSETGPAAVAIGVRTWKAVQSITGVVCGGAVSLARNLGHYLESQHEGHVRADVITKGLCLQFRTVFGYSSWSAVSC